ncbi:arylsulfotransferase family protein [Halorientalis marina]|uniref:arylsulfotransferase family protein n=1 Tax=Halorientalis marina TaxID=2931976 RepID=UPI001FF68B41|nr:arylsulfotransferase family protein [Halorientalis marina]
MDKLLAVRLGFVFVIVVSGGYVAAAFVTAADSPAISEAPPTQNITVATTTRVRQAQAKENGEIVAYAPDGSILYYNETLNIYDDVDPVEGEDATVEYVGAKHLPPEDCPNTVRCSRNVVERVDLSSGETTRLYAEVTKGTTNTRWHDVDRINESHLLVGDISEHRIFVVDHRRDEITWTWNASDYFDPNSTGGDYPGDWAHLNDVEMLEDGRIVTSLRNLDVVVFIRPDEGVLEEWTLGGPGSDRLHGQHNPDYIPEENGGPALLIADSGANRIVEFQRVNGSWERSWVWKDRRLSWGRDADRLPGGNTLITDTNGNRVLEVDERGEVVWQVRVPTGYEAERVATGDESESGNSAQSLGLESQYVDERVPLPTYFVHSAQYLAPVWLDLTGVGLAIISVCGTFVWGLFEVWTRVRRSGSRGRNVAH